MGSMPGGVIGLSKRSHTRFIEACKRGGKNAASARKKKKLEEELEACVSEHFAERAAAQAYDEMVTANYHILTPDGEDVEN